MVMVATYTLNERINAFAALFCTGFFIGTTVILLLVFVPKMVGLYLDPDGKKIFERTRPTHMVTAGSGESPDQSKKLSQFQSNGVSKSQPNGVSPVQSGMDPGIVESLQRKVKELEAIVSQYQHPATEDGPEAIQLQDSRVQFTKVVTGEREGGEVVIGEGEEEQERTIWDDEPPTDTTDM